MGDNQDISFQRHLFSPARLYTTGRWLFGLLLGLLLWCGYAAQAQLATREVRVGGQLMRLVNRAEYVFDPTASAVALAFKYGQATVLNPEDWDTARVDRRITEVELVFSHHPVDTTTWLRPFSELMAARLAALRQVIPLLADSASRAKVRYTLVRQTAAHTRSRAEQLFHGAIIHYILEPDRLPYAARRARQEAELAVVKGILAGRFPPVDSTLFRWADTATSWRFRPIVMDWTGSMYPLGATFLRAVLRRSKLDQLGPFMVFNDGDDFDVGLSLRHKPLGHTGGIHRCDNPRDIVDLLQTLEAALMAGDGGEPAENNLEALLYAQRRYRSYGRLVHLADNTSRVRDIALLDQLTLPVDVVACERPDRRWLVINLDLVKISWATGGSFRWRQVWVHFARPRADGRWQIGPETFVAAGGVLQRVP